MTTTVVHSSKLLVNDAKPDHSLYDGESAQKNIVHALITHKVL